MAAIRRAIEELHAEPEGHVVTPGLVYRKLGYRPQCGSCLGAVAKAIDDSLEGGCCGRCCTLQS